MEEERKIWEKLKEVIDPELGINLVDLGLIYEVKIIKEKNKKIVKVKMTLTTIGCPLAGFLAMQVENKIKEMGYEEVEVHVVWDPPWTPEKMSEEAKEKLGFR